MNWFYNLLIGSFQVFLPFLGFFFKRLKVFYQDRKHTKPEFEDFIEKNKKSLIWIHVASLGEYEQVVPVAQALKTHFKNHRFLLTFFSDSGYRIKKNKSFADFETYLPLDTPKQAKEFVNRINPEFAVFVKYDIWPNFLESLRQNAVKTYLIAARFRPEQVYFKYYGQFFRKALKSFEHIFVQDKASGQLLNSIDYANWTQSGDTRYDRVYLQLQQDNSLDFMDNFKQNQTCMVCGSTWREDEQVLLSSINDKSIDIKYIIAPHQINPEAIEDLQLKIQKTSIKYSEIGNKDLSNYHVLILDTIGLLTKVYAYADLAYVGGAMGKTGLHNILEPATFGVPIFIGPNHQKFPEAKALEKCGGLKVVRNENEFKQSLKNILADKPLMDKMSKASQTFIENQKGATEVTCKIITENF